MLHLTNISKTYQTDKIETTALSNINLSINKGEFISVMGPSGCGKSTLLNIIGLLDQPSNGQIKVAGQQITSYKDKAIAGLRNEKIGFIFQSFNLIPDLNLFDNVDVPLRYRGFSAKERKIRIENSLERVGLSARMKHLPSQLSGGQQQRVAIARALAGEPRFLLADEPTGNLDSLMARQVMQLLEEINQQGTTIIMVTHDAELARRAQRNIHIVDGQVSDYQQLQPVLDVADERAVEA